MAGVTGLVCAVCGQVVGAINEDALERMLNTDDIYICTHCEAWADIEAVLGAQLPDHYAHIIVRVLLDQMLAQELLVDGRQGEKIRATVDGGARCVHCGEPVYCETIDPPMCERHYEMALLISRCERQGYVITPETVIQQMKAAKFAVWHIAEAEVAGLLAGMRHAGDLRYPAVEVQP